MPRSAHESGKETRERRISCKSIAFSGLGKGARGGDYCLSSEDKDKKTDIREISIIECYLLLALSSLP